MARIIYGVAGEGFGHSSRSHLIGQRLIDAGHDGKVIVASLLPAGLFMIQKAFDPETKRKLMYFALLALVIGLALLSPHVQMTYYMLLMMAFFIIFKFFMMGIKGKRWGFAGKSLGFSFILPMIINYRYRVTSSILCKKIGCLLRTKRIGQDVTQNQRLPASTASRADKRACCGSIIAQKADDRAFASIQAIKCFCIDGLL